jgi:hypothetical protein
MPAQVVSAAIDVVFVRGGKSCFAAFLAASSQATAHLADGEPKGGFLQNHKAPVTVGKERVLN